jgi:hypothetical protein
MPENPVRAELEALLPGQLELISKTATIDVQAIADKLTAPLPVPADADEQPAIPFPPLPKVVQLTDEARGALTALPTVFGSVGMTERRILTDAEVQAISVEADVIETVESLVKARKEAIKETIRHHNDMTAQQAGQAFPKRRRIGSKVVDATPRDKSGHYLLAQPKQPFVTAVKGFAKGWEQRFTAGSTSQSVEQLERLYLGGAIERADYLGFTHEVRVLDEDKIRSYLRKNTDKGLRILKAITVRNPPNSSLYGPGKK